MNVWLWKYKVQKSAYSDDFKKWNENNYDLDFVFNFDK